MLAHEHEPAPRIPSDGGPFAGLPVEGLTPYQVFQRAKWERATLSGLRDGVRAYAARLLADRGAAAANEELAGYGVEVDSGGTLRFAGQWEADEAWRDLVAAALDEVGESLLKQLPDDTAVDMATGRVTIDDAGP